MHQWIKTGAIWLKEENQNGTRIWWGNGKTMQLYNTTPEQLLHLPPVIDYGPKEPKESQS